MCKEKLFAQCETTQEKGASLFDYTKLYGEVPGGQAEYLRVPQAHFGPIKVPDSAEAVKALVVATGRPSG